MENILTNIDLKSYNTFGLKATARYWSQYTNGQNLIQTINFCKSNNLEWYVLSGGSNIILTDNFTGVYIHPVGNGIELLKNDIDDSRSTIIADAGVNWDKFVEYCVERQLWGVECLSLIPGLVGASPVQNIGAYGSEASDHIVWVEYLDTKDMMIKKIDVKDCEFGYRTSIFKNKLKGRAIVTRVAFELNDKKPESLNLNYGLLLKTIESKGEVSLKNIRESIIEIRTQKLPDPKTLGNAGSFFKNPVVSSAKARSMIENYPQMPYYVVSDNMDLTKIPAGWLIEKAGWKGYKTAPNGGVGVHSEQALVLINHGDGTAQDILDLAQRITADIESKFGIKLEMEVNIL